MLCLEEETDCMSESFTRLKSMAPSVLSSENTLRFDSFNSDHHSREEAEKSCNIDSTPFIIEEDCCDDFGVNSWLLLHATPAITEALSMFGHKERDFGNCPLLLQRVKNLCVQLAHTSVELQQDVMERLRPPHF
ncbi:hypothetical protein CEXT_380431, partial [Caerostris extrusa]